MAGKAHVRSSQDGTIFIAICGKAVREIYCSHGCGEDVAVQEWIETTDPLEICPPTARCGCGAPLAHRVILIGETHRRRRKPP